MTTEISRTDYLQNRKVVVAGYELHSTLIRNETESEYFLSRRLKHDLCESQLVIRIDNLDSLTKSSHMKGFHRYHVLIVFPFLAGLQRYNVDEVEIDSDRQTDHICDNSHKTQTFFT